VLRKSGSWDFSIAPFGCNSLVKYLHSENQICFVSVTMET
jgi:hypothetical protein